MHFRGCLALFPGEFRRAYVGGGERCLVDRRNPGSEGPGSVRSFVRLFRAVLRAFACSFAFFSCAEADSFWQHDEKQKQKQEITRCPPSRPTFRSLSYSPHSSSLRMETRLRHALHMAYSFRRRPYKSNSHSPTGGLGRQRKKVLHMLPTVSELRNTKLHVCVNLWLFLRVQAGIRTSSFVRLQIGFVRCGKAGGRGGIPREGRSLTCAAWEVRRERKGREIGNTMTRRGPNSTNSPAYNPPGPTIRVNTPETQRRSHYINYVIY